MPPYQYHKLIPLFANFELVLGNFNKIAIARNFWKWKHNSQSGLLYFLILVIYRMQLEFWLALSRLYIIWIWYADLAWDREAEKKEH